MVWSALLAGGLSLLSGIGSQQSAKKQAKQQAANDYIANLTNQKAIAKTNATNKALGKDLGKKLVNSKVTTTERVTSDESHYENTDNYSYVDTDAMMQAAERSGFNPVTWLNAGGLQAYTQTGSRVTGGSKSEVNTVFTSKGHNAAAGYQLMAGLMSPQTFQMNSSQAVKVPNMLETVGDAGTAALNAYRSDNRDQENRDFQMSLLDKQLDAYNKRGQPGKSMSIPTSVSSGGATSTSAGGGLSGAGFRTELGTITNPWPKDSWMKIDPKYGDAESFEQRYSEPGGWLAGAFNMANDFSKSASGRSIPTLARDEWTSIPLSVRDAAATLAGYAFPKGESSLWDRAFNDVYKTREFLFGK